MLGGEPVEERTAVVEPEPDPRMALEGLEHRLVGGPVDLLDHPAEVADRLVVVEDEGESEARRRRSTLLPSPMSSRRFDPGGPAGVCFGAVY